MSTELSMLIAAITGASGASLAFWTGWRAREEWEPRGSYDLPRRRGSNPPPPGTKPQPPGGRLIGPDGVPIGYRSINYPDPSPGRRPTNPFNGERIPNPPPREP